MLYRAQGSGYIGYIGFKAYSHASGGWGLQCQSGKSPAAERRFTVFVEQMRSRPQPFTESLTLNQRGWVLGFRVPGLELLEFRV